MTERLASRPPHDPICEGDCDECESYTRALEAKAAKRCGPVLERIGRTMKRIGYQKRRWGNA